MKTFFFNITEKMYGDIFENKVPSFFFDGLNFIGGNSFRIDIEDISSIRKFGGKKINGKMIGEKERKIYQNEEEIADFLEKYGCAYQEQES